MKNITPEEKNIIKYLRKLIRLKKELNHTAIKEIREKKTSTCIKCRMLKKKIYLVTNDCHSYNKTI